MMAAFRLGLSFGAGFCIPALVFSFLIAIGVAVWERVPARRRVIRDAVTGINEEDIAAMLRRGKGDGP